METMPLLPCSDETDDYENLASKLTNRSLKPCSAQISGDGYDAKTAFTVAASNELQGKICQASIQNQIEWDYKGNRRWARRNLEKICNNAEHSLQPGTCFHRIMHGNIDHGGGTRWKWQAALKLCAGTQNSNATIICFSEAISRQVAWPQAIEQCRAKP